MDISSPTEDVKMGFTHSRDEENLPPPKRMKIESDLPQEDGATVVSEAKRDQQESGESVYIIEDLLPPSRILLPSSNLVERTVDQLNITFESDVGITEYVSSDVPPIRGIIKQRCDRTESPRERS